MLITYHLDHLSASIFFFPLVFSNSFLLLCLASFYCVLEIVCETAQTATEANCFQGQLVLSSCCAGTEWDWSLPFTQTGLELRWMKSTSGLRCLDDSSCVWIWYRLLSPNIVVLWDVSVRSCLRLLSCFYPAQNLGASQKGSKSYVQSWSLF